MERATVGSCRVAICYSFQETNRSCLETQETLTIENIRMSRRGQRWPVDLCIFDN